MRGICTLGSQRGMRRRVGRHVRRTAALELFTQARIDFGIDYNAPIKTGGLLLGNEISLQIDGSAVKQ